MLHLQIFTSSIHRIPIAGEMKSPTPAPKPSPKLFLSPPPPSSIVNDCSQEFCTPYCLQWCSANSDYLQPPPSFDSDPESDSSSSSSISPVLIVLICVLAAAFLLLFYCSFASKICKKRRRSGRRQNDVVDEEQQLQARFALVLQERLGPSIQIESSAANPNGGSGLDEGFIKSITVFKYKRGDGLVESTECAVCLTEFSEEEDLRLMPNCQHAFHPPCIDTWLRSQSSCPICRASMIGAPATAPAVAVLRMRFQSRRDAVVVVVDGSSEVNFVRREIDPDRRQTTMMELDRVEAVVEKEREVVG